MSGRRDSERGVALLLVLWIFMILTVIVAQFSRAMRDDAVTTHNLAEETSARAVALAGMSRAIYSSLRMREQSIEAEDTDDEEEGQVGVDDGSAPFEYWLPDGAWHEDAYGGGRFKVRLTDEGGKIPLNRADEYLLRRVFQNLGFDTDAQEEMADAIMDWRDRDVLARLNGAEEEYYLGLRPPYRPKDGPFDAVDELLAVRGMTRELVFGPQDEGLGGEDLGDELPPIALRDVFSVFNRSGNINVRTAPPEVLRVLMGDDVDALEEILELRTEDIRAAVALVRAKLGDRILARRVVARSPTTIAIDAHAMMDKGHVQARLGAIVEIEEDADGFYIVRWLDRLPAL
jgi:general secretion pathway protein K